MKSICIGRPLSRNQFINVKKPKGNRNEKNIFEGSIVSLKRFKEDVQEVLQNYECGLVLEFSEIENGDIVEAYEKIEESAKLS